MKHFAVHSVAALAVLALGARGAPNVVPYTFDPTKTPPGCSWTLKGLMGALLPCGDTAKNPCPIAVNQTATSDPTPVVPCNTTVTIGITDDVQGINRSVYGIVAGSAPDATFTGDIKFGMASLAFQQLCPFACMNGSTFSKCATSSKGCASGEVALDPKINTSTATVQGGFEQQTAKHEFAYKFDKDVTGFEPVKETKLVTPEKLSIYTAGGGVGFRSTTSKNCPKVGGTWSASDLTSSCGYGGRLPCPLIVKDATECFTDKCKSITFHRVGATGATGYCVGGTCKAMGEVTVQFKVVMETNSYADGTGPRGLLTPAAVKYMCPFVCGTFPTTIPTDGTGVTWLPICVEKASDCDGGKVVTDSQTMPFGTDKVAIPGSFLATPFIATNWTDTDCGTGINSAVGSTAPGLLVLFTAAVVAMYSS